MSSIPRETLPDSTVPFVLDPYRFIGRRCEAHASDVFEARILGRRTICMSGPDAVRFFYGSPALRRAGGAPGRIRRTLFGEDGVQGLDGAAHRARKALLLAILAPEEVEHLVGLFVLGLDEAIRSWQGMERVVLLDAFHGVLARAVTAWAGLDVPESEMPGWTGDLVALFESAAAVGPTYRRGTLARARLERRLAHVVDDVRSGRRWPPAGSALERIARFHGPDGRPLDARVAAVELLNLLRPTVAVGRYLVFGMHALHHHPGAWDLIGEPGAPGTRAFVHEVRRFYPFFPAVAARLVEDAAWKGMLLPAGARVLLDLYGTNRDPRSWERPEEFRPERFLEDGDAARASGTPVTATDAEPPALSALVPQGGGDRPTGHRCAGEPLTVELMAHGLARIARDVAYRVPERDLRIDMRRAPAAPRSGFVVTDVRVVEPEPRWRAARGRWPERIPGADARRARLVGRDGPAGPAGDLSEPPSRGSRRASSS